MVVRTEPETVHKDIDNLTTEDVIVWGWVGDADMWELCPVLMVEYAVGAIVVTTREGDSTHTRTFKRGETVPVMAHPEEL